ncbi:hypothetical protein GCM10017767_07110 [Halomonas urumqiensis]|nr:hypothetical protein GCM10017767_07110 [Halomonas urumqiensis]
MTRLRHHDHHQGSNDDSHSDACGEQSASHSLNAMSMDAMSMDAMFMIALSLDHVCLEMRYS